jgi:hypothetical protein
MTTKTVKLTIENIDWLLKIDTNPNKAITKLRHNDELTVSQFQELNQRINKIEKKQKELDEFIHEHSGGY